MDKLESYMKKITAWKSLKIMRREVLLFLFLIFRDALHAHKRLMRLMQTQLMRKDAGLKLLLQTILISLSQRIFLNIAKVDAKRSEQRD